jgi:hypothetical protein
MVMYLPGVTCGLYASASDDTFHWQGPMQGLRPYQYATMSVAIVIKNSSVRGGKPHTSRADHARGIPV